MSDQKLNLKRRRRKFVGCAVICILFPLVTIGSFWFYCVRMPEADLQRKQELKEVSLNAATQEPQSSKQDTAAQSSGQATVSQQAKSTEERLREVVVKLAEEIGERNLHRLEKLNAAADYFEKTLKDASYTVERQTFQVNNVDCHNLIAEIKGQTKPDEILIVGAHYDSVVGTPGANDNASGTAALVAIAEALREHKPKRTIRFVAFTNEEPPYFQQENEMGSWVYARACRKRGDNIVGVISLETMGYFTDESNSQKYPAMLALFYPSTGNFVGFVANMKSRDFLNRTIKSFRTHCDVPSEGASLPGEIQGVGWSDHWSFWQEDYVGLMVTDTAPFRYPHYHRATDTPDKIDFKRFAKTVEGLVPVVKDLADE